MGVRQAGNDHSGEWSHGNPGYVQSSSFFLAHSASAAALALTSALLRVSPAGATAGEFYAVATQGLRLPMRARASIWRPGEPVQGHQCRIPGLGGTADGYDWARVRVISSGKTGFVAYTFLTSIPSDGIPIGQAVQVEAGGGVGDLVAVRERVTG